MSNNNIYIADNARMEIIKYIQADPYTYETIHIGEHFMEFACLNEQSFILSNVFGPKGQKAKLAYFNRETESITPLLSPQYQSVNELDIVRCSQHYLYRSNDQILYNERFTPNVYSIDNTGKLIHLYSINSQHYIPEQKLKGLEKDPVKFMQETTYIKDIICLYENNDYFICMPFIRPSATYLRISKKNPQIAKKLDLRNQDILQEFSLIRGVVENRFLVTMNYSEEQAMKLKDKLPTWNEESNPILVLFTFK